VPFNLEGVRRSANVEDIRYKAFSGFINHLSPTRKVLRWLDRLDNNRITLTEVTHERNNPYYSPITDAMWSISNIGDTQVLTRAEFYNYLQHH
jgi:hypothetical protein